MYLGNDCVCISAIFHMWISARAGEYDPWRAGGVLADLSPTVEAIEARRDRM